VEYLIFFLLFGLLSYYLIFSCLSVCKKDIPKNTSIQSVSLIVCAKNEYPNLLQHLPILLNQQGIVFDLIVVNDASSDLSPNYLDEMAALHPQLKVIHLLKDEKEALLGKRKALLEGIRAATYDYVVLTDADCYPNSPFWLRTMAQSFTDTTDIVLGYSPYEKQKGFLNILIQYETLHTALQYLSFAKIGFPYMGVGRNIAYRKAVLNETIFQASNLSIGGDDDLLVAQIANKKNTRIQISPESYVYSKATNSFKFWMQQKQRHFNTAKFYSLPKILVLGGLGVLNLTFYTTLFVLLLMDYPLIIVLGVYLCKIAIFILLNFKNLIDLQEKRVFSTAFYIDLPFVFLWVVNHIRALKKNHGWS
jgi:cellulose synthase/poly-beta-1,6-N-acetylglucosamine synthase-like glycosyltransferase